MVFQITLVRLTGLLFPGSVLSPFLNSAVMFPSFQSLGTKPWHIDELNIVVIGFDIVALSDLPLMHPIEVKQECIEKTYKESEILKLLQNLDVNKSCGPDGLQPKMLRSLVQQYQSL
jgi:hypothetical protein